MIDSETETLNTYQISLGNVLIDKQFGFLESFLVQTIREEENARNLVFVSALVEDFKGYFEAIADVCASLCLQVFDFLGNEIKVRRMVDTYQGCEALPCAVELDQGDTVVKLEVGNQFEECFLEQFELFPLHATGSINNANEVQKLSIKSILSI